MVLPWLLELRRRRVAVILVHHAGRAGKHMRGTSRREDAAFWVLRLDATSDHSKDGEGARFVSRFTKARQGTREETEPLEWYYQPDGVRTRVTFRRMQTLEIFKQWVRDGLTSCSEIAEEMGLSKGAISKLARRGERDGWLKMNGRTYELTEPR
jgi:putative DNA primase/helicase